MQKVVVDNMSQSDLSEVCAVESTVFPDPWSYRMFEEELRLRELYALITIRVDGRLAAYGGILNIHDEAHITNLAVSPDYQSTGLGSLMLNTLIKLAVRRKARNISLEVRTDNPVAHRLYKNFSFSTIGVRRHYYGYEQDALIMSVEGIDQPDYLKTLDSRLKEIPAKVINYVDRVIPLNELERRA